MNHRGSVGVSTMLMIIDREISYEGGTMEFPMFKLRHFPLEGEALEKDPVGKASEVRRRKGGKVGTVKSEEKPQNEVPKEPGDEGEEKPASPPVKKDPRDPLKWFGIFVPPALKDAQLRFSNGSSIHWYYLNSVT